MVINMFKVRYKETMVARDVPVVVFSDGCVNVNFIPEGEVYGIFLQDLTQPQPVIWEALKLLWEMLDTPESVESVVLNYLADARADRVFNEGDAFPLYSRLDTFYQMFPNASLMVDDVHNQGAVRDIIKEFGALYKFTNISQKFCFVNTVNHTHYKRKDVMLVAPDKGASEKTKDLANSLVWDWIQAEKTRDLNTGKITSTDIPDVDLNGKTCIIVDDLLDAGGTFIPLAEKLREAGAERVELYVTHGIFAKGLDILEGVIDKIHVKNIIGSYVNKFDIQRFNCDSANRQIDKQ